MIRIKKWLDLQKEGIIVGTIVGILFYYNNWDTIVPIAATGMNRFFLLVFLGSSIGAIIDSIWKPKR